MLYFKIKIKRVIKLPEKMIDRIGESSRKTTRGFLKYDFFTDKKKKPCTDAHVKNPNFERRHYSMGAHGPLTFDE